MALQALSQGPPVALGPGSSGGAGACAEERGVAGSTPSGGSRALAGLAGEAASLAYRSAAQWGGEAVG